MRTREIIGLIVIALGGSVLLYAGIARRSSGPPWVAFFGAVIICICAYSFWNSSRGVTAFRKTFAVTAGQLGAHTIHVPVDVEKGLLLFYINSDSKHYGGVIRLSAKGSNEEIVRTMKSVPWWKRGKGTSIGPHVIPFEFSKPPTAGLIIEFRLTTLLKAEHPEELLVIVKQL